MFDDQLKAQLAAYLERVVQPFTIVASLDDSETAREMRELLESSSEATNSNGCVTRSK